MSLTVLPVTVLQTCLILKNSSLYF